MTPTESAVAVVGPAWPLVASWIGAPGAFVAGVNTVSDMTFALLQFATAENVGVAGGPAHVWVYGFGVNAGSIALVLVATTLVGFVVRGRRSVPERVAYGGG